MTHKPNLTKSDSSEYNHYDHEDDFKYSEDGRYSADSKYSAEGKRKQAKRRKKRAKKPTSWSDIGGTLIGMFVCAGIFGEGADSMALMLMLVAAAAMWSLFDKKMGQKYEQALLHDKGDDVLGFGIAAVVLAGIFGDSSIVALALFVIFALVTMQALRQKVPHADAHDDAHDTAHGSTDGTRGGVDLSKAGQMSHVPQSQAAQPAALPAQSSGEVVNLDVGRLCEGLTPVLAGQVVLLTNELKTQQAAIPLDGDHDARKHYELKEALNNHLPETVEAWKAQRHEDKDPKELEDALTKLREMALSGQTDDAETRRQAWEIQKRFLDSRQAEVTPKDLKL